MTTNVLLVQLVGDLSAYKEPDAARRLLAEADEWLGNPSVTAATRQRFWEALYLDLMSLTYEVRSDEEHRVVTVALEQIEHYRSAL
jgi:hypothetical protein